MARPLPFLALLALAASLAACSADAPGQPAVPGGARSPAGRFALRAAGPFLAGEEPVLAARAWKAGDVRLTLLRATDPVLLARAFDDLGHPTVEGTALRKALDRATAGGPGADTGAALGLERVRRWTARLAEGESKLSLGAVEPGLYLLDARAGRRAATLPVVVSDLSLVVKRAGEETLVWTVRARSGDPVAGATVTLLGLDGGPREIAAGPDGVVRLKTGDVEDLRIVATDEAHVAVADPVWLPPARRERLVYVTTDRPLYRAGETVLFRGIARRVRGEKLVPWPGAVEGVELVPPRGEPLPLTGEAPAVTDLGTFSGEIALPERAPLGDWRLVVTVDGRRYAADLRLEAFRRPEAEVLVAANPAIAVQGDPVTFRIQGRYYAGGVVSSAAVSWSVHRVPRLRPAWRSPEAETFLGETERRAATPVEIAKGEGKLDADGRLEVEVKTEKQADDVVLRLTARVRDEAGRTVLGSGSARSMRSMVLVDLRTDREAYETGEDVHVTVRVTDPYGRPVTAPVRLLCDVADTKRTLEGSTDENGLWRTSFLSADPGPLRLTAVVLDSRERERAATKTVWIAEEGLAPGYGGEGISIVPDRESYAPGDTARLLVLLPRSLGHAHLLVTVEGESLHGHRVELLREGSAVLPVRVERSLGTTFRVRAAAVRNGRVYGGEARLVAPPVDRLLTVEVTPDAADYRPGSRGLVRVKVTDRDGNPVSAEVGVAGVDEALLALQGELAPPVERFFHGPRPSRVRTFTSAAVSFYDATDFVGRNKDDAGPDEMESMEEGGAEGGDSGGSSGGGRSGGGGGAFRGPSGEVPPSTRSPAPEPSPGAPPEEEAHFGGASGKKADAAPDEPPRARFAATALWAPHVRTEADGTAVVPVTFPDDLTRWRFGAIAVDAGTRVGSGAGHAVTTRPLRLTVAAPRFLVERDAVRVPVVVRSPGHAGEDATVTVEADPRLESSGETSWTLRLAKTARAAASLDLRAIGRGEAKVVGRAALGDERDAVEARIPVRAHGVRRASVLAARLEGDRPWTGRLEIPRDARPGSVRVRLTIEPTRLAAVWRALDTLLAYPHGCTEQTLNRFLPDLAAQAAVTKLDLGRHPRSEEMRRLVAAGVRRLLDLQHEDGGWGWWAEDATDPGMTALVVRGLAEAKALGAKVPEPALARGVAALAKLAPDRKLDYPTRALALAALHAAGAVPDGLADRLFDDERRLHASPRTLVLLLPVLRARARKAEAAVVVRELLALAHRGDAGTFWGETNAERWQDDAIETTADVIAALAPEAEHRALVDEALRWLLARRDGPSWRSTRDTAAAVRAILAVVAATPGVEGSAVVRVRIDDGIVGQLRVSAEGWKGEAATLELPPAVLRPGDRRRLTLERAGELAVDATAVLDYLSTREDLPAVAAGMTVERTLHRLEAVDRDGRIVHERRDPTGARVGDLLLLHVTVTPEKPGEFLEIEVPFPAGAEAVRDDRAVAVDAEGPAIPPHAHRELRDDTAWVFLRRAGPGPVRLRVLLRVTHAGDFHVLPARAALMYFSAIHGASAEARLAVKEAK